MTDNDLIYTVIFITLVILLLIAGVAITIFVANKNRITQEIKMAQMQINYEKEMRTVQNEVQEQVLGNVSRELHDNIGQLLTVMHIQLEQQKLKVPDMAAALAPMHDMLGKVTQEVRMLGRSLNSDLLEQNGLLNTIAADVARLKQLNHIDLHWLNDATEPELSKDQRLMAYRIFQELINNSLKHAHAMNMHITLTGKGSFMLVVQDDGEGFNVADMLHTGNGAGLRNIIKRAALANLKCSIVSEVSKGSIFTLQPTDTIS